MNLYSIELIVRGTMFIKTRNLGKARYVLDRLSTNSVDFSDMQWFSTEPHLARPKVSFEGKFSVVSTISKAPPIQVSDHALAVARSRFVEGQSWFAIPKADEVTDAEWPVFEVSVDLTATVLVRADSAKHAMSIAMASRDIEVVTEQGSDRVKSSLVVLQQASENCLVIANRLYLVGASSGQKLIQIWPDEPYPAANEIPLTLSDEFHYLPE